MFTEYQNITDTWLDSAPCEYGHCKLPAAECWRITPI